MTTATLLDGKAAAAETKRELAERVQLLKSRGIAPGLGTILVGDDPASRTYVGGKHRDCAQVGIAWIRVELPGTATQADVEAAVLKLNTDPACTGFIVQLPLPAHIDMHAVLELIDPAKDADGLHPANLGRLVLGMPGPLPCTPRGISDLLRRNRVPITGQQFCVIGCGLTVGRPLGLMLTRSTEHATVTLCHEATQDTAAHARVADVVVAGASSRPRSKPPDQVEPVHHLHGRNPAATISGVRATSTLLSTSGSSMRETNGRPSRPARAEGPARRRSFRFLPCPAAYGEVGGYTGQGALRSGTRSTPSRAVVAQTRRTARPGVRRVTGLFHLSGATCTCSVMQTNCWWQLETGRTQGRTSSALHHTSG